MHGRRTEENRAEVGCMEPHDFLIAVIAHRPEYRLGFEEKEMQKRILGRYPAHKEFFSKLGVRPHHMHGDSLRLQQALSALVQNGAVKLWEDGIYSWDLPDSPTKYYNSRIAPQLYKDEKSELLEIILEM